MKALPFETELISRSVAETEQYAARFYRLLAVRDVVALYGPLGAGKTCFVRGVAKAAGVNPVDVTSPSFTLINEYLGGQIPIFHFDLYRLRDPIEFYSTGGDDYFARDGVIIVEWAEKGGQYIPEERYNVRFDIIDQESRRLIFSKGSP